VELLLQHNCNVNQVDSRGNSALHALANKVVAVNSFFMDADTASVWFTTFRVISPEREITNLRVDMEQCKRFFRIQIPFLSFPWNRWEIKIAKILQSEGTS
jgi:hypothetical protein